MSGGIAGKGRIFSPAFAALAIGIYLAGVVGWRQCCPSDFLLVPHSSTCSDNRTRFALDCKNGALLLDPSGNEGDDFQLEEEERVIAFDGEKRAEDQFCLGKIRWNESSVSPQPVALVCFASEPNSEEVTIISVFLRLLMVISIIFLLFTLYVYLALPTLRDLQGKCVIAFICSLVSSYVTLLVVQTWPNSSKTACVVQAAILYFFMSACFFWNNVITFSIWKAIRKISFKFTEGTWLAIYFSWGFGAPFLMVVIAFILEHVPGDNHVRPRFAETKCWFKGKSESWNYFHGPVSVLLLINMLMFLQSSWTLWRNCRHSHVSTIRSLKSKCVMYLKLFLLMGISWVFEMISYATNDYSQYSKYLWLLTDCLNSAQGVFIFFILGICRQKVRLGLLENKILGIPWPRSWAKEKIQESSITFFPEDFELAKQKAIIIEEGEKVYDAD